VHNLLIGYRVAMSIPLQWNPPAPWAGAELPKQFIGETIYKHQVPAGQLNIHANRSWVRTSKPVACLMADLGPPYVSDDNLIQKASSVP
jgi:hypothetical protein